MEITAIKPTGRSYSQGLTLSNFKRLVFISGQVPETADGTVPVSFDSQCRLAWKNVEARLHDAGLQLANLVKVTIFLAERQFCETNAEIRHEILKEISPALTIIITGIYDEKWLVEIEAIAAD